MPFGWGKDAGIACGVGRTIVGQHLDGFEHDVAHVRPADARIGDGAPSDDLAVVRVKDEGAAGNFCRSSR